MKYPDLLIWNHCNFNTTLFNTSRLVKTVFAQYRFVKSVFFDISRFSSLEGQAINEQGFELQSKYIKTVLSEKSRLIK